MLGRFHVRGDGQNVELVLSGNPPEGEHSDELGRIVSHSLSNALVLQFQPLMDTTGAGSYIALLREGAEERGSNGFLAADPDLRELCLETSDFEADVFDPFSVTRTIRIWINNPRPVN